MTSPGVREGFTGTTSVVTGGASGIGEALATEIARRGGRVVVADRQVDRARSVAQTIVSAGGQALASALDVRDGDAFMALLATQDRVDYLFNNAGIVVGGDARRLARDDWLAIVDVNLHGVINGVQAALPIMTEQGSGHIVNTASLAGLLPSPRMVPYAATKHAVVGLSTSLRAELAPLGIRVSVLCPGAVDTAIADGGKFGRITAEVDRDQLRRDWQKLRPMPPSVFARKTLDSVLNNRAIIIHPRWWRMLWWCSRFAPAHYIQLMARASDHGSQESV